MLTAEDGIDDTKRHGQAMKMLQDAGIYVFTVVSTRFNSINRMDPYSSYHRTAMTEIFQTVNVMAEYPNALGILAGASIINSKDTARCAPIIKAVVRDLKKYMELQNVANGQRVLPVGYSAATVEQLDTTCLEYLSLGDPATSIDFWAVSLIHAFDRPSLIFLHSAIAIYGQDNPVCKCLATRH